MGVGGPVGVARGRSSAARLTGVACARGARASVCSIVAYFDAIEKIQMVSDKHLHSLSILCEPMAPKKGAKPAEQPDGFAAL